MRAIVALIGLTALGVTACSEIPPNTVAIANCVDKGLEFYKNHPNRPYIDERTNGNGQKMLIDEYVNRRCSNNDASYGTTEYHITQASQKVGEGDRVTRTLDGEIDADYTTGPVTTEAVNVNKPVVVEEVQPAPVASTDTPRTVEVKPPL